MRERVVRIGKPSPLAGVVTEPKDFDASKPAVVILNSGVMHHIGSCRLSVKIARRLAESGYMAVRFDFSGIGDSVPRPGGLTFTESAPLEVKEVMDYLQAKRGVSQFILYGLCSGADASYETAKVDERVIGMCQIDSYCYRDLGWYLRYYGPRMLKLDVWQRFVGRLFSKLKPAAEAAQSGSGVDDEYLEMPSYIREFPPKEEVEQGLSQLTARNIAMYNIFTGGQVEILNAASQYASSFSSVDFKHLLKVDFYEDAKHIITEPHYQVKVVSDIVQWVNDVAGQNR